MIVTETRIGRDRETERERAHRSVREDDLAHWTVTGGDMSLWPSDWNREPRPGGARNPFFIPRELRSFYSRSAERDAEVKRAWPEDRQETPDSDAFGDPLPVNGYPVTLSGRDPELVCHWYAMQQAHGRKRAKAQRENEAFRDCTEFRCESCEVIDRASVRRRDAGAWKTFNPTHPASILGPRLCPTCADLIEIEVDRRHRERTEASGADQLADGQTRINVVRAWIDANAERIMRS